MKRATLSKIFKAISGPISVVIGTLIYTARKIPRRANLSTWKHRVGATKLSPFGNMPLGRNCKTN